MGQGAACHRKACNGLTTTRGSVPRVSEGLRLVSAETRACPPRLVAARGGAVERTARFGEDLPHGGSVRLVLVAPSKPHGCGCANCARGVAAGCGGGAVAESGGYHRRRDNTRARTQTENQIPKDWGCARTWGLKEEKVMICLHHDQCRMIGYRIAIPVFSKMTSFSASRRASF